MDKNSCKHIPPSSVCGRALKLNILPILSSSTTTLSSDSTQICCTTTFWKIPDAAFTQTNDPAWHCDCQIACSSWGTPPRSKRDNTHNTRRSNEQPTCPSHCRQYYLCGIVVPGTCWLTNCKHPFHKGNAHQIHQLEFRIRWTSVVSCLFWYLFHSGAPDMSKCYRKLLSQHQPVPKGLPSRWTTKTGVVPTRSHLLP